MLSLGIFAPEFMLSLGIFAPEFIQMNEERHAVADEGRVLRVRKIGRSHEIFQPSTYTNQAIVSELGSDCPRNIGIRNRNIVNRQGDVGNLGYKDRDAGLLIAMWRNCVDHVHKAI